MTLLWRWSALSTAPHHTAQGDMNKTGNEEECDLRPNEMSCLQDLPARLQRRRASA